jgi:glycosyltransferase involved in cell wall biosynthesis
VASKICVIIPAYNSEETIGPVVSGALKHVSRVLMADDGSTDQTAQIVAEQGADVISIGNNRGKGNALKVLFQRTFDEGYDAVISMDADGQHDPEEIPRFIAAHENAPNDIIVGSRMREHDKIPRGRFNSMHIARFFISIAANQFIEDTQCGYRLYPMTLIQKMKLTQDRYITESEILMKAGDMGAMITSVNIGASYEDHVSHFKPVMDVATITAYIISYLMVKFIIEGLYPDRCFTYSKNNFRDRLGSFKTIDRIFKIATVLTIMPTTFLCWLMYLLFPFFKKNNFASIRKLNCGYFKITLATNLLPVLLVISILEKVLSMAGIRYRYVDKFILKYYPHLWGEK